MLVWPEMARTVLPASVPIDSTEATRALNALEADYDYVLYVAEPELTPWSEKAIRQADLVLAVGRHWADERPNALERLAAELLPPDAQRLVLLHETRGAIIRHGALAGAPLDRHAPPRGARQRRRCRAALPLHQRHGAGPRRLRRRRLLRGPRRPLQGAGAVRPDLRHHGRHLRRRRHDGRLRHGRRARRDRPRHARHVRHQPGHAPLHLAALQPDRPHQLRSPARQVLFRRRHRGSVDPLLLRLHQPVELRLAPPPPGRPVGCRACQRLHSGAAAALPTPRTATCWSTAPSSTTCRSA